MGRAPLRGVEFAVITLAIAFMLEQLARAGGSVSGGQNGILIRSRLEIPGVVSFHRGYGFYAVAGIVLVVAYLATHRFVGSRQGLILRAVRENEDRVDRLGYQVTNIKRSAFAVSAAMASLAGVLFYVHDGIVSPVAVGVGNSTLVLLWVVLGGRGTLVGPVVGALVLSHLTATLSGTYLDTWLLVVGAVMVVAILAFPAGFLGWIGRGPDR
ncbi:MAG: branched-chain amino acid ABC transporter permease [Acidimicrobiales bacterium]